MTHSSPELKPIKDLLPIDSTSSPAIANTHVVRSCFSFERALIVNFFSITFTLAPIMTPIIDMITYNRIESQVRLAKISGIADIGLNKKTLLLSCKAFFKSIPGCKRLLLRALSKIAT